MYLPHSHKYPHGYVAWWLPEFEEYFAANYVQIPLRVGDAAFFNPAVFHGAGTNVTTEIRRMANLLQVSSAFGRAMETVDRYRMIEALYPAVVAAHRSGRSSQHIDNAIAASAEGYAFPTNLDRDPPLGGLTPDSQADVVRRAVHDGWSHDDLRRTLELHRMKRNSA